MESICTAVFPRLSVGTVADVNVLSCPLPTHARTVLPEACVLSEPVESVPAGELKGTNASACAPTVGEFVAAVTVNVAALELVLPPPLLTTQRNWSPLSAAAVLLRVKLEEVAPAISANVDVPLSIFCHWYVIGAAPDAVTVKVTGWPCVTVWLAGCCVMLGA